MGIRAATTPDLVGLEELEKDGLSIEPSQKYEAIVRYLVSQKYGTVSALCEATELTRPSVQTRIFKGAELGNKVLTALAQASGVSLKELHTLSVRDLRSKLDKHLSSETEDIEDRSEIQQRYSANSYFSYLFMHYSWEEELRQLRESSDEIDESYKSDVLQYYSANLFLGSGDSSDLDSEIGVATQSRIFAPCRPMGLRVSICGLLSPRPRFFDLAKDLKKMTPPEVQIAFIVLVLGKDETQRFQEIVNYVFDTRNALNSSFGKKAPKFCVLTLNDESNVGNLERASRYAERLKPLLADTVIEVDPERLDADAHKYSTEIFVTMLESLKY